MPDSVLTPAPVKAMIISERQIKSAAFLIRASISSFSLTSSKVKNYNKLAIQNRIIISLLKLLSQPVEFVHVFPEGGGVYAIYLIWLNNCFSQMFCNIFFLSNICSRHPSGAPRWARKTRKKSRLYSGTGHRPK